MITFTEDFKDSAVAVKRLNLHPSQWGISEGTLFSKLNIDKTDQMAAFFFGDVNWRNYEVEFKIRQISAGSKHQLIRVDLRRNDVTHSMLSIYTGGTAVGYIQTVDNKGIINQALARLPKPMGAGDQADWSMFKIVLSDSVATVYVDGTLIGKVDNVAATSGFVRVNIFNLNIMVTDLKVTVVKTSDKQQEIRSSRNILPNSSFEFCTQDSLPDYWGCMSWGIDDPPYWAVHFDEWRKHWGTDNDVAFSGGRSVRITNPDDKPAGGALWLRSVSSLGTTPGKPYTFSAYMKSDTPGMRVSLSRQREVALSTEWQRYSVPYTNKGGSLVLDAMEICPVSKGTLWVDAVQLEEESETTPYCASLQDMLLASQSG
ncbi:MAG: hypothetical protein PHT33_13585, partial [bacterium]|nr:hypothetical protein [bacterium]